MSRLNILFFSKFQWKTIFYFLLKSFGLLLILNNFGCTACLWSDGNSTGLFVWFQRLEKGTWRPSGRSIMGSPPPPNLCAHHCDHVPQLLERNMFSTALVFQTTLWFFFSNFFIRSKQVFFFISVEHISQMILIPGLQEEKCGNTIIVAWLYWSFSGPLGKIHLLPSSSSFPSISFYLQTSTDMRAMW